MRGIRDGCGTRGTDPPPPDPVTAVLNALQAETAANRTMTENLMKNNQDMLHAFMTEMRAERAQHRRDDSPPHTTTVTPTPTPSVTPQQRESGASHHTGEASQPTIFVEPSIIVEQYDEGVIEERRLISFRKHKPPTFLGSKDPKVVTTWLQGMDKIFQVMRCRDPQKFRYSVYMLEGDAHEWWCDVSRPFVIQGQELTWNLFENLFHEQYFPRDAREAKQGEFDCLVQGSLSIDEYAAKFNELVKFANYGGTLPTSEFLSAKFQRGLNEKIAKRMANTAVRNFADLITQCKRVETVYSRYLKSSTFGDAEVKRTNGTDVKLKNNKDKGLRVKQSGDEFKRNGNSDRNEFTFPKCDTCGKHHGGTCWFTTKTCFKCDKLGHFAHVCPTRIDQVASVQEIDGTQAGGQTYILEPLTGRKTSR
ncbi:uncharacterized protein LOC133307008 [Gastrolobium bilobum]|uniref:uncharacterized protein LOC133307008 n=1 Tax=Gastrolobium bilobum TaxID=150636 RepID=UPI002AB3287C|nr:uncharacterized protein LOC133307008 [Gastrolobium bilobum]